MEKDNGCIKGVGGDYDVTGDPGTENYKGDGLLYGRRAETYKSVVWIPLDPGSEN